MINPTHVHHTSENLSFDDLARIMPPASAYSRELSAIPKPQRLARIAQLLKEVINKQKAGIYTPLEAVYLMDKISFGMGDYKPYPQLESIFSTLVALDTPVKYMSDSPENLWNKLCVQVDEFDSAMTNNSKT